MQRYLAHHIIHQGKAYTLALLTIDCREGVYNVCVTPFEHETADTPFHNGTIAVCSRMCSPAEAIQYPYTSGATPPELVFF